MLERWYPWGWAPNVFAIDYAKLQALGYKGILFDIYRRGAKMLGLPVEQVVCIGDQVFRDIRGANRCGMASILVDFIRLPQETHYGKKRVLEKYIMACWRRNPRWRDRLGNIQK